MSAIRQESSLEQILESRPFHAFFACLVILGTVVVFLPGIQDAASGDDFLHIFKNQSPVKDWFQHFLATDGREYRPLVRLSLALENFCWGQSLTPRHVFNLIIHLGNILLVLILSHQLTGCRTAAVASASLFALHPSHTYSVNAVMGRTDTLLCLFFVAAILAALQNRTILAVILFILALLSKELAVTLPVALFCLALPGLQFRKLWKTIGALVVVDGAYLMIRLLFLRVNLDDLAVYYAHSPLQVIKNVVYYAGTLVFPFAGHTLRLWQERYSGLMSLAAMLGCVLILVAWRWRKQLGGPFWLGIAWCSVTLLPVLFLFQRRFLYLASIGFCISMAWILSRCGRRAGLPILLVAIVAFGWRTYASTVEWQQAGEESNRILDSMLHLYSRQPEPHVFLANVPNGLGEAHIFTHDSVRYALGLKLGTLPAITVLSRINYSEPTPQSVQTVTGGRQLLSRITPNPAHYFVFDNPSLLPKGGRFSPKSTRFRKRPFTIEVVNQISSGQSSEVLVRWTELTARQELWLIQAWSDNRCVRISSAN